MAAILISAFSNGQRDVMWRNKVASWRWLGRSVQSSVQSGTVSALQRHSQRQAVRTRHTRDVSASMNNALWSHDAVQSNWVKASSSTSLSHHPHNFVLNLPDVMTSIHKSRRHKTSWRLEVVASCQGVKQYVGAPIDCWCPAQFTQSHVDYTNTICWVNRFSLFCCYCLYQFLTIEISYQCALQMFDASS